MKCPDCGLDMDKGKVEIQPTLLGFVFFGFSYKHLYFTRIKDDDRQVAVRNDEILGAHRCPACGCLVIIPSYVPGDIPLYPPDVDGADADLFEPNLTESDYL